MINVTVSINQKSYGTSYKDLPSVFMRQNAVSGTFSANGSRCQQVFGITADQNRMQTVISAVQRYCFPYSMTYFSNNDAVILIVLSQPVKYTMIDLVDEAIEKLTGIPCIKGDFPIYTSQIYQTGVNITLDSILYSFQLKMFLEGEKDFACSTRKLSRRFGLGIYKSIILPMGDEMFSSLSRSEDFSANFFPKHWI